jgi:uncharacterized protein YerC
MDQLSGCLAFAICGIVELWLSVFGYEGLYEVSNLGRVVSLRDKWRRMRRLVLSQPLDGWGYPTVGLCSDGKARCYGVHRLVAMAFVPRFDLSHNVVRHLDGNPLHNESWNLAWGTDKDNADDRSRHGRTAKGETSGVTHLTGDDIVAMRQWSVAGMPYIEIARRKGVSISAVGSVVRGDSWGHIVGGHVRPRRVRKYLSDDEKAEVGRLYRDGGWTQREIASWFGVSQMTVSRIVGSGIEAICHD